LIKEEAMVDKTEGGIIIPDMFQEKTNKGRVMQTGAGCLMKNGKRHAVCAKVGECVLYGKRAGVPVEVDGENYLIIENNHVVAILKEGAR
jgi:chaperonin GroES